MGTRNAENMALIHPFLKKVVPSLRYLLTVCTGSALVAQTGLLDGRKATSNKRSWSWVVTQGLKVDWVPKARWVVDDPGNGVVPVWSSSGIAAGMDAIFAWVKNIYGQKVADDLANSIEYERHEDSSWDPYAAIWGVPGAVRVTNEADMVAKK
jgi:transcriptional regulator GlxA family with amidase domain